MKAALCPLSYRDLNGKAYIDGMILFYETNNIAPLKDAFLQGYVASAERLKVYATESRRTVLAIEVIYDKAIKMAVREAVRRAQDGQSVESTVDRVLRSAPENDRALLKTHINEILLALHPDGAIVYDLMPDEVETFRNMRPMPS